jgi:hypothetical protein
MNPPSGAFAPGFAGRRPASKKSSQNAPDDLRYEKMSPARLHQKISCPAEAIRSNCAI